MDIAVAGIGRWGRKLLCSFSKVSTVRACCNRGGGEDAAWVRTNCRGVQVARDFDSLVDMDVDAIAIATPPASHYALAKKALGKGKHVFVEKPMALSSVQAAALVSLAEKKGLVLMTGHTFLYDRAFRKALEVMGGRTRYAKLSWSKFGTFDESMIWNLLPHEVAISIKLLGVPKKISVLSAEGIVTDCDQISVRLGYPGGRECIMDTDRLGSAKSKSALISDGNRTLRIEEGVLYRLGKDGFAPIYRSRSEPLALECRDFVRSMRSGAQPFSDGKLGLDVVKALELIEKEARK
jgi:predicted dehydrogenase